MASSNLLHLRHTEIRKETLSELDFHITSTPSQDEATQGETLVVFRLLNGDVGRTSYNLGSKDPIMFVQR